jgi:hypothetical protein
MSFEQSDISSVKTQAAQTPAHFNFLDLLKPEAQLSQGVGTPWLPPGSPGWIPNRPNPIPGPVPRPSCAPEGDYPSTTDASGCCSGRREFPSGGRCL